MNSPESTLPWYRHRWPWIIISIPLTSVVLGVVMLVLALNTNNSLVVDDYYKEGKAINQRIERDMRAREMGLVAEITTNGPDLVVQLSANDTAYEVATDSVSDATPDATPDAAPNAPPEAAPEAAPDAAPDARRVLSDTLLDAPAELQLKWLHVTRADLDQEFLLQHAGAGRYVAADAAGSLPTMGRWHVQLEPSNGSTWRLTSPGSIEAMHDSLRIEAVRQTTTR